MDASTFDRLTRALSTTPSRRKLAKTAAVSVVAAIFGRLEPEAAPSTSAASCDPVGAECAGHAECCSLKCSTDQRGQPPAKRCCLPLDKKCRRGDQCCSGHCDGGRCRCLGPTQICTDDHECCSGVCDEGVCGTIGCQPEAAEITCDFGRICGEYLSLCGDVIDCQCGPGHACKGGHCRCDRDACPGCCNGDGTCDPDGTSDDACGFGGAPCDNCTLSNSLCTVQGCCPETRVCGADCCRFGCCDGGADCLDGHDDTRCGRNNESCADCTLFGGRCAAGRCVCDKRSCPSGCCNRNPNLPVCENGNSDDLCGGGGKVCEDCTAKPGGPWTCKNQKCCIDDNQTCPSGCKKGKPCKSCCTGRCGEDGKCGGCVPDLEPCPQGCQEFQPCPGCCGRYCSSGKLCFM
jgi:hypothetical protein